MIDDVIWGNSTPEQACGMNPARITALYAGLPNSVPGVTVNRFCSSGLQAISMGAEAIISDRCDVVLGGGCEHMSLVPMGGIVRPNPAIAEDPVVGDVYTSMGQTAENVAARYNISREEMDLFAVSSHQKAAAARKGVFKEEIVPVPVQMNTLGPDGKLIVKTIMYDADEGVREDISLEGLAKLKSPFVPGGNVTAGNSSQMSDGAAAAVVMSEKRAKALEIKPLARYVSFATAGYKPEEMGLGPVISLPKALKLPGLKLDQIDVIELNEAFAAQSLAVI
jgi:acetyl-CoA acyltransferase